MKNLGKFLLRLSLPAMLIVVTGIGFVLSRPVRADKVPAFRLQVSPTQVNLGELKPGKTYVGAFEVQNTGTQPYSFDVDIAPYSVEDENYSPNYTERNGYTEIANWITLDYADEEVQPNTRAKVQYTIAVPSDAPSTGQNAAILVTLRQDKNNESTGIQTVQQVAFLMYSNVSGGNTRKTGSILKNSIPGFLFTSPIVVSSVVENSGNVYAQAEYKLEIRNIFGNSLAYTNEDKPDTRIIFPETSRYAEISWDGAPQLGIFKVKQTITIFDQTDVQEKILFLCPIWFLILVLIIVAIFVFRIVNGIMRRRQE